MGEDDMLANILDVYHRSSEFDKISRDWYRQAHAECEKLADKYNLTIEVVCGVVAAISPRLKWEVNISEAEKVITGKPCRALGANVKKARAIIDTGKVKLGGPKVNSFYRNLLTPDDNEAVTIDTWAARIAIGDWNWTNTVDEKLYWKLADEYRQAAAEVGLLPSELQAITWESIRRVSRSGKGQLTLDL